MTIPYVKPVRVGNFKLWRRRQTIGKGKDTHSIDCLIISNLEGSWRVCIPSTMAIYGTIFNTYMTTDDNLREDFLGMLFTNYYNLTTTNSEVLHDAFFFLQEMATMPYLLLSEDEMVERMRRVYTDLGGRDVKSNEQHIAAMCDYRKQLYELIERKKSAVIESYEQQVRSKVDDDADAAADVAAEVLGK